MRRAATGLFSVLLVLIAQAATASEPAAVGVPLPAFTLERLGGGEVSEADLAGHPALVVFFDTACPYCKRLAPGIERTWQRYGEQGLRVLAISFREQGNVQAWRTDNEVSFDIAIDGDAVAAAFGATSTPTWFFVDAEGVVRFRGTSADPDDPVFDLVAADLLGIDPEDCDVALC